MLDIFTTDKYDTHISVIKEDKSYTVFDIKKEISKLISYLRNKKDNIVILGGDNYKFIIQFFASVYAGKNIYLVADKTKLKDLEFEYDIIDEDIHDCGDIYNFPIINPKDIVINFFTSGSSGKPKSIKKTLFNLLSEGEDIGKTFNLKNSGMSVISTTTMCHLFGMTFHLMTPFCNGLVIDTTPITYPENVDKENVILASTPSFLETGVNHNLDFVIQPKYIISAGSKLDEKVFEQLEKKTNVIEIYGSTESGIIGHRTKHNELFTLFEKVNIEPQKEFLTVQSDYIYGGEIRINDSVDVIDGKLKINKRTDRLFKISEKRVSADEIETKLRNHLFIKDCYITEYKGKLACLCVLSEEGKQYLLEANISDLIKYLKRYSLTISEIIPQKWKFIDKIPLNEMGKIDKTLINHIFSLKLSLPIILDRKIDKDIIEYKVYFYDRCNFFQGHFDVFPLVPGVVQIYFAKEFAKYHYKIGLGEGQWKRVKFSNVITPNSIVNLRLEKKEKNVCYEYYSDDKKYASGVFLCENVFNGIYEKEVQ